MSGSATSRADWRLVENLYHQCIEIVKDPEESNVPPDDLIGFLAQSLGRVFSYYHSDFYSESQFADDVHSVFAAADFGTPASVDTFKALYYDTRWDRIPPYKYDQKNNPRPRPKPFESVVETCRRIRDINDIGRQLKPLATSGVLGGSASYGRFFNVRGIGDNTKSSDADLLLVLQDYSDLRRLPELLAKSPAISPDSVTALQQRIEVFDRLSPGYLPLIFSHKINCWTDRPDPYLVEPAIPAAYQLSLHVCSAEHLDYIVLRDLQTLSPAIATGDEFMRPIWDYRDTEPTRKDNQRSFIGVDFEVTREYYKVELGYISESRVCHISDGRYFPGLYQNLILPQYEIRWEAGPLRPLYLLLAGFRWKIVERLRQERTARPHEYLRLSLSHTRSQTFAPHVRRRVDGESR